MAGRRNTYAIGNNALVLNEVFSEQAIRRKKVQPAQKVQHVQPAQKVQHVQPAQKVQQANQANRVKKELQPEVKPQPRQKTGLFSTLFVIFSIFAVLSYVIARYAVICSTSNEINDIKTQMQTVQQNSDELKADIAVNLDLGRIQDRAKELKMGFPTENQIIYLDLQDENNAAVADDGENQVSKGDEKNINVLSEIVSALE